MEDLEGASYTSWKTWAVEDFGNFSYRDMRYFKWILSRFGSGRFDRYLELGFGNGQFMGFVRSQGGQVTGIETQLELLDRAHAAGFDARRSIQEIPANERFDLVAAFDVMEHVPQAKLTELIGEIMTRLNPGGIIVCRVPNGESPFGRMNQHGDLTHCSTLGVNKFRQIGHGLGLEVTCLGEAPWHSLQDSGRSPRAFLRAMLRRVIERTLAFAYRWNADALGSNVLVCLHTKYRAQDGQLPVGLLR